MTAPKIKTRTEKEQVLALVAKLDRRGWTQWDIANGLRAELGLDVSQTMVSSYLRQIRERYKETQREERQAKVNEKMEQLRDVRAEAWRGWLKSHQDAEKLVEEWGTDREAVGDGDYITSETLIKQIKTREGRLPDNAYLTTVMRTLEAERELLGLDEVRNNTVTLEQAMQMIGFFKDAARELLADAYPHLFKALLQKTAHLVPRVSVKEAE